MLILPFTVLFGWSNLLRLLDESLALVHGLEWYLSLKGLYVKYDCSQGRLSNADKGVGVNFLRLCTDVLWTALKTCHSRWALFVARYQSALAFLSAVPAFLQPGSFGDISALSDFLSSHVTLGFRWVPGHAGLHGGGLVCRGEAALPFALIPSTLAPVIARTGHAHYATWRRDLSHNSLFCQIPSVRPWAVARFWGCYHEMENPRNTVEMLGIVTIPKVGICMA